MPRLALHSLLTSTRPCCPAANHGRSSSQLSFPRAEAFLLQANSRAQSLPLPYATCPLAFPAPDHLAAGRLGERFPQPCYTPVVHFFAVSSTRAQQTGARCRDTARHVCRDSHAIITAIAPPRCEGNGVREQHQSGWRPGKPDLPSSCPSCGHLMQVHYVASPCQNDIVPSLFRRVPLGSARGLGASRYPLASCSTPVRYTMKSNPHPARAASGIRYIPPLST